LHCGNYLLRCSKAALHCASIARSWVGCPNLDADPRRRPPPTLGPAITGGRMNVLLTYYRTLLVGWLVVATGATFAAIANALSSGQYVY
jgi:hypothetical protein